MERILVDTSVWVNLFKNNKTKASDHLDSNFADSIITTCPTIIQEVLQGVVTPKDYQIVNACLNSLTKLIEEPYSIAIEAAFLYRNQGKMVLPSENLTIVK